MRSFAGRLWWRARHATVPLLLPGLLCLAAAIVGQALNVSGVNVPVLHGGSARWFVGLLGAGLVGLALVVGVEPPPRAGGLRGALPELPPNHVVRPELLGQLRAALLDGTGGKSRLVGVWGMAGSGKSVLAAALAQDPAVRRRFPDGLAWVRLEPPAGDPAARRGVLAQRQQELAAKLTPAGQVTGEVTNVEQGRDRLAELLRDRACLVVVDNVWTKDDMYAFSVLDRRGALLVTTRDAGLVRAAAAAEVEVDKLSNAQARTLAARWAGVPEQLLPPPTAETLRRVGNLALGVATVAALARGDGQRWAELADRLRRADLAPFELRFPGYPHPSLLAALQLGVDYLDASARQRYLELAVFAGRGAVPRSAVEALWAPAGLSATDAGDLLARFGDQALLRRDPATGRIDLHNLQFDLARADLGGSLPAAHDQLLAGYAARCPRGWPSGPDDGYFYQHLAGHLAAASRPGRAGRIAQRRGVDAVPAARRGRDRAAHRLHHHPGRDRAGPGAGHDPAVRARPGG